MRDDFPMKVKQAVAARVNYLCSCPSCRASTSGPQSNETKSVNVGVAAHITAASENGPRYDNRMNPEERRSVKNAIWLCETCAKLIDTDPEKFTVAVLRKWKDDAETEAERRIGKPADHGNSGNLTAVARATLLDKRFEMAKEDYLRRGTPKHMIDTFADLTQEEKAELYDRVLQWKKGQPSKNNPYR